MTWPMIPLAVLAVLVVGVAAFAALGGFRRGKHAGPRHHGRSEPWFDELDAAEHPFAAVGWMRRCGYLAHPQADRCGIRRRDHPELPGAGDAPAGYVPCPDCGGGPSDLHDECRPSLTMFYDRGLTGEQMERFREGFREALRESAEWHAPDEPPSPSPSETGRSLGVRGEPPAGFLAAPACSPVTLLSTRPDGPDPTGPLASWKPQPTEFLAAPMPGEPAVNVDDQLADAVMKAIRSPQVRIWQPVTVEPTLPPLPSFTPVFRPHACPDVPRPGAWTPPDEGMREHVAAVLARPARSALGSWVDDVLAAPPGLGHLQPEWEDGGWAT